MLLLKFLYTKNMFELLGKIFLTIFILIIIFALAVYLKFFHDVDILWLPGQIGCIEDDMCQFSDFHNTCGNNLYTNFKGHYVFTSDSPSCQCSFFVCRPK